MATFNPSDWPVLMIGNMALAGPDDSPTVIPPPSPSFMPVTVMTPLAGTGTAKVLPRLVNVTVREYPSLVIRTTSPSSTSVSQSVIQARRNGSVRAAADCGADDCTGVDVATSASNVCLPAVAVPCPLRPHSLRRAPPPGAAESRVRQRPAAAAAVRRRKRDRPEQERSARRRRSSDARTRSQKSL